jgi:predicted membrane protein
MNSKKIGGIVLLVIGASVLLDQLSIFSSSGIIGKYWPLAVIFTGMYLYNEKNITEKNALIIIGIGLIFQLNNLGLLSFLPIALLWPIVLIGAGLYLFTHQSKSTEQNGDLNIFCLFSGVENKNLSKSFNGGNVFVMFGGAEIDLRQSEMTEVDFATIDIFCMFGGVEIKLPQQWNAENHVLPIFGGVDNKINNREENKKQLKISGFTAFGGVELYH